jgi:hypothetical protein
MPRINGLTVIHTTADEENAGSDADFQLQVVLPGEDLLLPFENLPNHDDRERGNTEQYDFDLSGADVDSDAQGFQVIMRIVEPNADDGWLPSSILVIGHTANGVDVVLGSHPDWRAEHPTDPWFDLGGADAAVEQVIAGRG